MAEKHLFISGGPQGRPREILLTEDQMRQRIGFKRVIRHLARNREPKGPAKA